MFLLTSLVMSGSCEGRGVSIEAVIPTWLPLVAAAAEASPGPLLGAS